MSKKEITMKIYADNKMFTEGICYINSYLINSKFPTRYPRLFCLIGSDIFNPMSIKYIPMRR